MTMPASPLAAWSIASARCGLGHRAGEQLDVGRVGGAAEHAAGREVAEHRGDRAEVLLGEHLGRRQQGGLAAGVDDAQHRAQRDQGLAGADLALEQAVHRVGPREVGLDLGRTSSWPPVSVNGSRSSNAASSPPPPRAGLAAELRQRGAAAAPARAGSPAPRRSGTAAAPRDLRPGVGRVDPTQGGVEVGQLVGTAYVVGQQVGHLVDDGEREGDRALEVPRVDALGERVEREQRLDGGRPPRRWSRRRTRRRAPSSGW